MKPYPKSDFPISVREETVEHLHLPGVAQFYRGIFGVRLNFTAEVVFVPRIEVDDLWPPGRMPENLDEISSEQEARKATVLCFSVCITPNDESAGTRAAWTMPKALRLPEQKISERSILYVTETEFSDCSAELAAVAEQTPFVHDAVPLSSVRHLKFVELLLARVISRGLVNRRLLQDP
ncbi:MAG TPA: hypothetical protein VFO36_12635 [Nitrospiraceae bacterium]|nr:hypothetical protein [Nitrospiraceae bacterium]